MAKKKRKQRNLDPEPGGWVMDPTKGLPKTTPPADLPDGKIDTKTLRDQWVAYEGLGYCIYDVIPATKIEDPTLRALWRKARQAMQDVVEHMEEA
ncbi:MAG: hypothetical protein ACYSW8_17385 [Planctomycetota bacterium]|jgi:hypothetical protein